MTNTTTSDTDPPPTLVLPNGSRYWMQDPSGVTGLLATTKYHRLAGPAVDESCGRRHWYLHGRRHRVGGPAITEPDGSTEWYLHGKLHRTDGPAADHVRDGQSWYLHDAETAEAGLARWAELTAAEAEVAAGLITEGMTPDDAMDAAIRLTPSRLEQ